MLGGPAYPPGGAERQTSPRLQAQTVLPHVGGPAYPPDGAERHQIHRIQAHTVLPHVGGPAYPPDGADTTSGPPATGPDSFTSCRRGGLGEPKAVRLLLPRAACSPSPPGLPEGSIGGAGSTVDWPGHDLCWDNVSSNFGSRRVNISSLLGSRRLTISSSRAA